MIDHDDADELGCSLVEELINEVDSIIIDRHVQQQLVPQTIHAMMNQVCDIVDVCIHTPRSHRRIRIILIPDLHSSPAEINFLTHFCHVTGLQSLA